MRAFVIIQIYSYSGNLCLYILIQNEVNLSLQDFAWHVFDLLNVDFEHFSADVLNPDYFSNYY